MSGMQTTSELRKLMAQKISCEGPTLLKWLQTWSLASRKLGRILDPENTGTTTFSTLSASFRPSALSASRSRNPGGVGKRYGKEAARTGFSSEIKGVKALAEREGLEGRRIYRASIFAG